jgi:FAD binding domain
VCPVRSLIIERYLKRLAAPKAHALSPRSLELCRQFGLDTNTIRRLGTSRKDAYWVNFSTSLAGDYIGSLPYERMDAEVLAATPLVSRSKLVNPRMTQYREPDDTQHRTAYVRGVRRNAPRRTKRRRDSEKSFFQILPPGMSVRKAATNDMTNV